MDLSRLILIFGSVALFYISCGTDQAPGAPSVQEFKDVHVEVLGIAQDAGYPQVNCKKSCCLPLWNDPSKRKMVSCIGLRDPESKTCWLFDATPDIRDQLYLLQSDGYKLGGIFLTHGHMGHYTGLMHLGREALGADKIPVFAMPRMAEFLKNNGPWSQLVELENIKIVNIQSDSTVSLRSNLEVVPLEVPHRDEFTETVGYQISSDSKSLLFIPDIDKWHKWDRDIKALISEIDYALLDGTFYKNGEIRGRDMSLIPHPFIEESLELFSDIPNAQQSKIHFIHLNHTNPLLDQSSVASKELEQLAFDVCFENQIFGL